MLLSSIVVLPGIRDRQSLELISMVIGDWDRPVETVSNGRSESISGGGLFGGGTRTTGTTAGTSWTTRRERIMDPAHIAQLAGGQALAIVGSEWGQMPLAMWDQHPVWRAIARGGEPVHVGVRAGERPPQAFRSWTARLASSASNATWCSASLAWRPALPATAAARF